MHPSDRSRALASCAVALAAALSLTGCGRGPVEPIPPPAAATVTVELFVQGQITPSQGDYIIAVNSDFDPLTNINSASSEQPGEPTIVEAYGTFPAPFTHWDQAFIYGSGPSGLPNCPLAPPNGFIYCYKSIGQIGGQVTIKFVPITLSPNSFIFVPNANGGTGTGNAMAITLPLDCFDNGGSQALGSCGAGFTFAQAVTQLYVNLITLDTTGTPQDQFACIAGFAFTLDLTTSNSQQLVKPANCTQPPPPGNANLLITGGQVVVTVPGA